MAFRIGMVVLCIWSFAGFRAIAATDPAVETSRRLAEVWLSLVDRGEYAETWDRAAPILRTRVAEEEWIRFLETTRARMGKPKSRKFSSAHHVTELPVNPPGEYVVVEYEALFPNGLSSHEVIIVALDADGEWYVADYYLR
jgi:hypothetical protein